MHYYCFYVLFLWKWIPSHHPEYFLCSCECVRMPGGSNLKWPIQYYTISVEENLAGQAGILLEETQLEQTCMLAENYIELQILQVMGNPGHYKKKYPMCSWNWKYTPLHGWICYIWDCSSIVQSGGGGGGHTPKAHFCSLTWSWSCIGGEGQEDQWSFDHSDSDFWSGRGENG